MDPESKSQKETEAIVSEQNFEIITTFAYSTGLSHNTASLSESHCYLLQHGIDRLKAAALDLFWTSVVQNLSGDDCSHSLAEDINAHMLSTHGEASRDPNRRFIVRLAFNKDAKLSIMSGPRPASSQVLYYPLALPAIPIVDPSATLMPVYLDAEVTRVSLFTKHKTTHRQSYNEAWSRIGLDQTVSPAECDVLLQNENGQIMGAVFRTVYFSRDGGFVTPSSVTGCKLGVSRRWALDNANVKEAVVAASDVKEGEVVWLSSAVGGFIQGIVTLKDRA